MRKIISLIILFFTVLAPGRAQELFNFTEPASNMPAKSLGIRLNNWVFDRKYIDGASYYFTPEAMWGVNKNLMLHLEGFFNNSDFRGFRFEGAGFYAKYRFYSHDKVYRHFRMAGFGRMSTNGGHIHQEEIETNGMNSGFEGGLIFTQLLHKLALSSTVSFEHATNNRKNDFPSVFDPNAVNYTLSAGRLILPKNYTSYRQTNFNVMLEFLGQTNIGKGKSFLDMAPSLQLIINSQTRVDVGYKMQLYSGIYRAAPNGFLVRVEHLFFNAIGKRT